MRLVRVTAPAGMGARVADVALDVGIPQVSVMQVESRSREKVERKEAVDAHTSTPLAKRYMDALAGQEWFDPHQFSMDVREPRAILTGKDTSDTITYPFVEPVQDVLQQFWPFAHVTPSFVGRVLVSAALIAYGMIHDRQLIMVAGLLFMPILPVMLAIGFGALTRDSKLVGRALLALGAALALCLLAGLGVASVAEGPIRFQEFTPMLPAIVLSAAIGIAAGYATTDDVGWRELIGLGAASQFALIPVWLGAGLLKGWGEGGTQLVVQRAETLVLNVLVLIAAGTAVHALVGMRRRPVKRAYHRPSGDTGDAEESARAPTRGRAAAA